FAASRPHLGLSVCRHEQLRKARYERAPIRRADAAHLRVAPMARAEDGSGPPTSFDKPGVPATPQTIRQAWQRASFREFSPLRPRPCPPRAVSLSRRLHTHAGLPTKLVPPRETEGASCLRHASPTRGGAPGRRRSDIRVHAT